MLTVTGRRRARDRRHARHARTPATPAEPPAQSTCCNNCDYIFNDLLKLQLDSAKCSVYELSRRAKRSENQRKYQYEPLKKLLKPIM